MNGVRMRFRTKREASQERLLCHDTKQSEVDNDDNDNRNQGVFGFETVGPYGMDDEESSIKDPTIAATTSAIVSKKYV